MKKTLMRYQEQFLLGLTVLFFLVVVGIYVWGVGVILAAVNSVTRFDGNTQQVTTFDLKSLESLNLKGKIVP